MKIRTVPLAASAVLLAGALALAGALVLALAGCSAVEQRATSSEPSTTATANALGAGFADPQDPPAPEATFSPAPGSWSGVHPPAGFSVVLLSYGDSAETDTLRQAVTTWADAEHVALTPVVAKSPSTLIEAVAAAIDKRADLVVTVGNDMVDPLAAVSPGALHQRFLVLGAEIAEPTSNVTAADWTGGGFRGEGLGTSSHYDASTFTLERAGRALRAGVAADLNGLNGTVVWVD